MLRILSYIRFMRRLCICLLISLPALLAESALPSSTTITQTGVTVDTQHIDSNQIQQSMSATNTRQIINSFIQKLSLIQSNNHGVKLLNELINTPSLTLVEKEASLLRLTQHLRSRTPTTADMAVMQALTGYQSKVQTTHHDDPRVSQPAFNIAASAQGTLTEWRYLDINTQIQGNSATQILQLWTEAGAIDREHILRSLRIEQHTPAVLSELHDTVMQQALHHPGLAVATTIASGDIHALTQLLNNTPPTVSLNAFIQAMHKDSVFSHDQKQTLMEAASQHDDPSISGMAMHHLAKTQATPDLLAHLINRLSDINTGASAAMSLAQTLSNRQLNELIAQSDTTDTLLQARIQLIQQLRSEAQ